MNKVSIKKKIGVSVLAYMIVVELVLGGSGRLLTIGNTISLRYILFFIAICYFALYCVRNNLIPKNIFYVSIYLFFLMYIFSVMSGIISGYSIGNIIKSSQGYLYLLMIFPFSIFMNDVKKTISILRIFINSAVILAIISIVIFLIFGLATSNYYVISPMLDMFDYGYISIRGGLPAVFLKTSPYMAIAFIIELFQYINLSELRSKRSLIKILILFIGCITTMSMGIWIAVVIGVIGIISLSKGTRKFIAITTILIFFIVVFYMFSGYITSGISNRLTTDDSSFIIKLDQLYTLLEVWLNSFFFGNGFGIEVLFHNDLNTREMVNFELFWIQILVNMGLLGFILFSNMFLISIVKGIKLSRTMSLYNSVHIKSLLIGLLVLCVVSSVNPFLNNPIGLGYFIIVMCTINAYSSQRFSSTFKKA